MREKTTLARDTEGYLIDPTDWDESIARMIAGERGLTLTDAHWTILRFMRDFWTQNQIAPDVRDVTDHLSPVWNIDKKEAKTVGDALMPGDDHVHARPR